MYPIITEIEPNTYEIFGVKLEPVNDIETTVSSDGTILNPLRTQLLKKILQQNENDSIFYNGKNGIPCASFDFWMQSSQEFIYKNPALFKYSPIAPIYAEQRFYPNVYDKMLITFEEFFYTGDELKEKIYLLYELSRYIRSFHTIGFRLVRQTEKKTIIDKPNILPFWLGCPNAILKANTEALMLLTGSVTYIDENKETSIILDGQKRELVPWKDITPKRSSNGNFYSTYSLK